MNTPKKPRTRHAPVMPDSVNAFRPRRHRGVTIDDRASAASIDNYQFGVYSCGQYGPLGLSVGVAQAWHSIESNRSIAFPGFSDQAHARYGAITTQFFAEASYTAQLRPRATIGLGYSAQIGKRAQDHAIKGGVTWTF